MKTLKYALIAVPLLLALPSGAQAQTPAAASSAQPMSAGVVKKIDAEQSKITISHGPLTNLDMPAMTMSFRVADPKLLATVRTGDNIKFAAEKVNGAFTVVRLEQAGAEKTPASPYPAATRIPGSATAAGAAMDTQPMRADTATMPAAVTSAAQDNTRSTDPANPAAAVPGPVYTSAFGNYQAAREPTEAPDKIWRAANDEVARIGGHAGQIKETPTPGEATSGPSAPASAKPMTNETPKSPSMPAGHDMHNMNKGK